MRRWLSSLLLLACLPLLIARDGHAAMRSYLIAIGNNEPPPSERKNGPLSRLRYADDDAAAMARLAREQGAEVTLLSVLDPDSQRRFPGLTRQALPPTLFELRRTVARLRARFELDRQHGDEPVVIFYYSGHGVLREGDAPGLAFLDGLLTRALLYDELLAALPARYVHLLVDACHAEAVVRPRDAEAEVAPVGDAELSEYAANSTLDRFPQVGAVIATSTVAETLEWDAYERGIFTHELESALRGAADVNRDGKVEYSELAAFLTAANAEIAAPRGKLQVIARAPAVNAHAPLSDLSLARHDASLIGPASTGGRFFIEDERGNRLIEMHSEERFQFELRVPSGERLYVHGGGKEASFVLRPGEHRPLASILLEPVAMRPRGALETALNNGLFATPFGPVYYRIFAQTRQDLTPVAQNRATNGFDSEATAMAIDRPRTAIAPVALFAGAGLLIGASAVFSAKMLQDREDYDQTNLERSASLAYDRFIRDRAFAIGTGAAGAALGIAGTWLLLRSNASPSISADILPRQARVAASLAW
jgi:hypothetical protein